ncbi:MAG: hypothetical protein ACTSQE_07750 [Candidatus Heimdallarchaeaceae archaeon]
MQREKKNFLKTFFSSDIFLFLILWLILFIDVGSVIPVYATHNIDEFSGTWSLAFINALMMLMHPGIVFYIFIFSLLARNVFSSLEERRKIIFYSWLFITFSAIVLIICTLFLQSNEYFYLFYIGICIFLISNIFAIILIKRWSNNHPLSIWWWVIIGILTFLALPWLFAHVGIYISDIPVLNLIFVAKEPSLSSYGVTVHLGNHHGLDGYLYLFCSILMIVKWLDSFPQTRIKTSLLALFSCIQAFGLYLFIEDFTSEQFYRFFNRELLPQLDLNQGGLALLIILIMAIFLFCINYILLKKSETALEAKNLDTK